MRPSVDEYLPAGFFTARGAVLLISPRWGYSLGARYKAQFAHNEQIGLCKLNCYNTEIAQPLLVKVQFNLSEAGHRLYSSPPPLR